MKKRGSYCDPPVKTWVARAGIDKGPQAAGLAVLSSQASGEDEPVVAGYFPDRSRPVVVQIVIAVNAEPIALPVVVVGVVAELPDRAVAGKNAWNNSSLP